MLSVTDNDPTMGVCVPVVEPRKALGVGAPLARIVVSDCAEYTEVPPEGAIGDAAVSRLDLGVFNPTDEREESRSDGLISGLLCSSSWLGTLGELGEE